MHSWQGSRAGSEAVARQLQSPQPSEALLHISDESLGVTSGALGCWVGGLGGNLGVCLSGLPVCPFVHLSQLFSSLSFLLSVSLSLLQLPSSLASSTHPFFPFHSGGCSENTMQAQLCQAHMLYHGMAPLPAQGKPWVWPTPNSLPSPWKVCWPIRGLSPGPTPLLSPVWLSMLRELLESKTVGYPWLVVRISWGAGTVWYPSVFSMHSPTHPRASSRVPAASQSSGCYDSDSLELPRQEEGPSEDSGPGGLGSRAQATNGGSERSQPPRSSGLRRQAIQNWQRRPRRHSTEGEEGDVSDVGSRTTESEAEGPSDVPRPGPAVAGPLNSCRLSGKS